MKITLFRFIDVVEWLLLSLLSGPANTESAPAAAEIHPTGNDLPPEVVFLSSGLNE